MYDFAYCWAIDNKVNWSAENAESLMKRMDDEDDRNLTQDFIESATPGSFITLESGALVFCVRSPAGASATLDREVRSV